MWEIAQLGLCGVHLCLDGMVYLYCHLCLHRKSVVRLELRLGLFVWVLVVVGKSPCMVVQGERFTRGAVGVL